MKTLERVSVFLALFLLLLCIVAVVTVFHVGNKNDIEDPQRCISYQLLVNKSGDTLTFQDGQVLNENQMVQHDSRTLGKRYCTAWSRF